jgi:hypothetical protein
MEARPLERDAYAIQSIYMKQHSLVVELNPVIVAMRSPCRDPDLHT